MFLTACEKSKYLREHIYSLSAENEFSQQLEPNLSVIKTLLAKKKYKNQKSKQSKS